jgi:YggT family protein
MDPLLRAFCQILYAAIDLYIWVVIIGAILSWLVAFNVVNIRNRFIYTAGDIAHRLTEPALRPLRRLIPSVGGLDLAPLALIFGLLFVQRLLINYGLA